MVRYSTIYPLSSLIGNFFPESGNLSKIIRRFFYGSSRDMDIPVTSTATKEPVDLKPKKNGNQTDPWSDTFLLAFCFIGLMASYLLWGLLQEKIMTTEYIHFENEKEVRVKFTESQFLIFANRLLAFCIAGFYILISKKTSPESRIDPPLYKYSISSITNILSAWFQYEALKFVNFPTQVLAKSCKIIPIMVMGKLVSRVQYHFTEYIVAFMISSGMILFMLNSGDQSKASAVTTVTGVFLLSMYMASDSFNSTWQGELFKTYRMTTTEMMFFVNLFSTLFTASSLLVQSGFLDSVQFAMLHPEFIYDCLMMSITATVGQLYIYYTINKFGALVFTIIMTVRQAVAILLSCLIYNHAVSPLGIFGITMVFLAIFLRAYCNQFKRHVNEIEDLTMDPVIEEEKEKEGPVK